MKKYGLRCSSQPTFLNIWHEALFFIFFTLALLSIKTSHVYRPICSDAKLTAIFLKLLITSNNALTFTQMEPFQNFNLIFSAALFAVVFSRHGFQITSFLSSRGGSKQPNHSSPIRIKTYKCKPFSLTYGLGKLLYTFWYFDPLWRHGF